MRRRFPEEFPSVFVARRDWGETIVEILLITLALAALVWLILVIVRTLRAGPTPTTEAPVRPDDAIARLRMRYAAGEIGRKDYVQALIDLGAPPPPPVFVSSTARRAAAPTATVAPENGPTPEASPPADTTLDAAPETGQDGDPAPDGQG